ncbi:MAG TPA: hypothetical protein VHG52_14230 [Thermomicrobiales bacterium]|nr:hypothetical protein [Thermomicrobiales bacterium]
MKNSVLSQALALVIGGLLVGSDIASAHSEVPDDLGAWVNQFAQSEDLDCEDFETQEEAQAVLDEDPADPNNLDPNQDGIACALLPSADDPEVDPGDDAPAREQAAGNQTPEERRAARRATRQQDQEGSPNGEESAVVSCADYETAEDAQAAFDEDPEGLADLDPDGNGIACEEFFTPEPTTEPDETTQAREERRRNRRNQAEESAPTEVVIDEPTTVRIREDVDCVDFEFQEEAQVVLDEDASDPYNLDPSGDGVACSSLPSSDPRVLQVPRTGTGTPSGLSAGLLAAASISAGLAGTGVIWRRRVR